MSGPSASLVCGVGFADLSGFTALTQLLTPAELSTMLTEFGATVSDVVHADGGRVVKFLGDAVMWVSSNPERLAKAALDLVDHPRAREAGIAGPRRVSVTARSWPSTVITSATRSTWPPDSSPPRHPGRSSPTRAVHEQLPDWPAVVQEPLQLKGFDEPVTAYDLRGRDRASLGLMLVSTQPGYLAPTVAVASSLPRRSAGSAVLIVPVFSSGDDDQPGAQAASAEHLLPADAVAEIEAGLRALNATGAVEQVNRLVVPRCRWPAC